MDEICRLLTDATEQLRPRITDPSVDDPQMHHRWCTCYVCRMAEADAKVREALARLRATHE